jgi:hypothetical protein
VNFLQLLMSPKGATLLQLLPPAQAMMLKPLLQRKRLEDITDSDLDLIGDALDVRFNVTDELKKAVRSFIRGTNFDTVSDMLQSPDTLAQIIDMYKNGAAKYVVPKIGSAKAGKPRGFWDCVECGMANFSELVGGETSLTCTECGSPNPLPEGIAQ